MARLLPWQVEEIEELAAKGKSGTWIARHLDLPPATINYRMLRAGFDPWPGPSHNTNQAGAFSPEEDARILELAKTMPVHRVAEALGRARTSVVIRLMTLEVRAEKKLEIA